MIDPTDQFLELVKGIVGKAFLAWPRKTPSAPYAILDIVSRTPEIVDADGSEVAVRLTYTVGILAPKPSEARELAGRVVDTFAAYNFHTSGFSGIYEDPNNLYRVNVTLQGVVDRRGATFR